MRVKSVPGHDYAGRTPLRRINRQWRGALFCAPIAFSYSDRLGDAMRLSSRRPLPEMFRKFFRPWYSMICCDKIMSILQVCHVNFGGISAGTGTRHLKVRHEDLGRTYEDLVKYCPH